jgi:acyl-CoA reductase-like NAD-dependent aldehyde dehydrogenase
VPPSKFKHINPFENFDFDMSDVHFTPLLIDGEHRPASTGASFPVHSPHTGALASTSAAASSADCRAAIEAAQRAFPAWEATSFATRRDILLRAAETIQSEAWQKKVAPVMLAEVAAPHAHALFNFFASVGLLKSVATLVNELKGETLPSIAPGGHVFVQRRALGVVCVFFFRRGLVVSPVSALI